MNLNHIHQIRCLSCVLMKMLSIRFILLSLESNMFTYNLHLHLHPTELHFLFFPWFSDKKGKKPKKNLSEFSFSFTFYFLSHSSSEFLSKIESELFISFPTSIEFQSIVLFSLSLSLHLYLHLISPKVLK